MARTQSPPTDAPAGPEEPAGRETPGGAPGGRPARTGTAVALVAGLAVAAFLLRAVPGLLGPTLLGAGGSVALALALWTHGGEGAAPLARVLGGLLVVPAAVGLGAGTAGVLLVLVGRAFPVEEAAQVPVQGLLVVGRLGVSLGLVAAALGLALGVRTLAGPTVLRAYFWTALKTALLPALGGVFALLAGLARVQGGTPVADGLGEVAAWILAPAPLRTHLATAAGLIVLAVLAVRGALGALPIAEVLADRGPGRPRHRPLARAVAALTWAAGGTLLVGLVALGAELGAAPAQLRGLLGPALYDLLVALSTAGPLRVLVVGVALVAGTAAGGATALRGLARTSPSAVAARGGPYAAGGVVLLAAFAGAGPVLAWLRAWIAGHLPGRYGETFGTLSGRLIENVGAPGLVLWLVTALVALVAGTLLALRLVLWLGYLDHPTAGFALAASGLFAASALAGAAGAGLAVVVPGLVGALVVWDAGEFATTLGHELGGAAPSRRAELVHVGGTVAVGAVGAGLAVAAGGLAPGSLAGGPATVAALAVGLAGVVLTVAALR